MFYVLSDVSEHLMHFRFSVSVVRLKVILGDQGEEGGMSWKGLLKALSQLEDLLRSVCHSAQKMLKGRIKNPREGPNT